MKIRSQQYAQTAYVLVESVKQPKDEYEKIVRQAEQESSKDKREALEKQAGEKKELVAKYRTLALTFPNMVLQSGLCQAVGFLLAKGESHHELLLKHLTDLLNSNEDYKAYKDYKELHCHILKADLTEYQLLTRRALEAASWLKRYTQALLPNPNDNKKE